jgi:hypothetical protein
LRRVKAFLPSEIDEEIEERISPEDFSDLLELDLIVKGRPRLIKEAPEVWLAVEISSVIDRRDVERAMRRAGHLRQAGLFAIPTVAGEEATFGAKQEVRKHKVLILLDGRAAFWEEALKRVFPEVG